MNPLIIGEKHLIEDFLQPRREPIKSQHTEVRPYPEITDAFCVRMQISLYNKQLFDDLIYILAHIGDETFLFAGGISNNHLRISEIWELGLIMRSEGLGVYSNYYDSAKVSDREFEIELEPGYAMRQIHDAVLEEFVSIVNEEPVDPYLLGDDLDDSPVECVRGDAAELERVLEWVAIIYGNNDAPYRELTIATGCYDYMAEIVDYETSGICSSGIEFARLLLDHFEPSGYRWEYNDGHSGRRSGYSQRPHVISISLDQPSALERADALSRLTQWTANARLEASARRVAEKLIASAGA